MTTPEVFDIAAARTERAKARAAQREGRGDLLDVRFHGTHIATLAAELPLDVLAPLKEIDLDLVVLVRQALDTASTNPEQAQRDLVFLVLDILSANPRLPTDLIDAAQEMARRLFGEEGYQTFVGCRPSREDVTAVVQYLMRWFGVSLGESSGSSTPQTDGATSKPISDSTTISTPATSGDGHQIPDSSASVTSPDSSSDSPTPL